MSTRDLDTLDIAGGLVETRFKVTNTADGDAAAAREGGNRGLTGSGGIMGRSRTRSDSGAGMMRR